MALLLSVGVASAEPADVLAAEVECTGNLCRFKVTVQHPDTGWEHYANRFEILTTDGKLLGYRVLRHPHVKEQPFTRSTSVLFDGPVSTVIIRAHDSMHGYGGREITLNLPMFEP